MATDKMSDELRTRKTCGWPSRSNWPVTKYDGRWFCSLPPGHDGQGHVAYEHNDPDRPVVWEGPWVPEGELKLSDREYMGMAVSDG